MKPNLEFNTDILAADIRQIIRESTRIIEQLSEEKVDHNKTRIFKDNDDVVHVEVTPSSERGIGIHMYIYSADDIIVGVSHGAHEHFDKGYPGDHIPEASLTRFKELLHSKQSTTVIFKEGKPYSWTTIFYLEGREVSRLSSTEFPTNPLRQKVIEEHTFSYL